MTDHEPAAEIEALRKVVLKVIRSSGDEIERLRADMGQITGFLAGVGTIYTEEEALAHINNLPTVQEAWVRWAGEPDDE